MPGGGHELVKAVVAVRSREQKGISLLSLEDFLDGMTDAPVGPIHMTGHDEEHSDRHMVVSDVSHPEASGYGIQPTLESEEIAVGGPVAGEESSNARTETRIQLSQKILVEKLVGQR